MRERVENIFTYYRGPSRRSEPSQLGRQLEDNATAALLKTIKEVSKQGRNPNLATTLLQTLVGENIEISETASINCYAQRGVGEIPTTGREVYLVGLSPSDLDIGSIGSTDIEEGKGIVDGVIEIGNDITLVLEAKTQGDRLRQNQLQRYADTLGLQPERYNTATWREVASAASIPTGSEQHPVTAFLLDEFVEFIELTTLNRTIAATYWDEQNPKLKTLTLRHRKPLNRRTEVAERDDEPPRLILEFKSEGHKPIAFSPSEWSEVVEQFPQRIQEGFVTGDFDPFIELMDQQGRTTIASVGEEEGVRKFIEVNPDKKRITFQSETSAPYSHYINRPTLHETDFIDLYKKNELPDGRHLPYLSPGQEVAEALFRDGDIEKVVTLSPASNSASN